MTTRRTRGDGGLTHRHDHPTCPPLVHGERPEHKCKGRWAGTLDVVVDGKKRRKYVYGDSLKAARIALAKARREYETGALVMTTTTVAQWADHWVEKIADRSLAAQTVAGYRSKVDRYIIPHLGRYRLTALRPEHVRNWHDTLMASGGRNGRPLSASTVHQAHAVLTKCLGDAHKERKLAYNPAAYVKPPRVDAEEKRAFTAEQAGQILRAAGNDLRVWLAIFYGLRQGEALGLRWRDVDLDRGEMVINQTLQMQRDRTLGFGPPKSRKSNRPLPLLPGILLRFRLHMPAGVDPDHLVFCNADGSPIRPHRDLQAWYGFLETVPGVPRLTLHAARHTANSALATDGVPIWIRQRILGHATAAMTDHYTHTEMAQIRDALAGVWARLGLPAHEGTDQPGPSSPPT